MTRNFDIDKFELEIWKNALDKAEEEYKKAKEMYRNDPISELINVELEFRKIFVESTPEERATNVWQNKIKALSVRQKKAQKLKDQGYDTIKCGDMEFDAKWKMDQIHERYINLKFRYDRRNNG